MINGELVIAYAWWEGQPGWIQIFSSNNWPVETSLTTTWKVKNTGDEAATFKVSFMGLESVGVLLNPGEETDIYLYPVTPVAGTYNYTLGVIADSEVVAEYTFEVITAAVTTGWVAIVLPLLVIGLLAGILVPIFKKGI